MQDEVNDTGLMMMGHRFYDPTLGRFLNRDPIGFAGGLNLFSYGGNNPATFTDHTGLFVEEATFIGWTARQWIAAYEIQLALVTGGAVTTGTTRLDRAGAYAIIAWLVTAEAGDGTLQGSMSPAFFNAPGHADAVLSRAMRFKSLADAQGSRISSPCQAVPRAGWVDPRSLMPSQAPIEMRTQNIDRLVEDMEKWGYDMNQYHNFGRQP